MRFSKFCCYWMALGATTQVFRMKELLKRLLPVADPFLMALVFPAAFLMKKIRAAGVHNLPLCKRALMATGVFPIRDHYYEPQFDNRSPKISYSEDRYLPGIDWNTSEQLDFLKDFVFSDELIGVPRKQMQENGFYLDNGLFGPGDAEYWYQIIRTLKPKTIIEVGSGNSTLMAIKAIEANIRDVVFEFLRLLPMLNKGVVVHVHDIFSPKNYPNEWLVDEVRFWNEQYLLEAFLTHNSEWRVLGALNYLFHHHPNEFKAIAPFSSPEQQPRSFYIKKVAPA